MTGAAREHWAGTPGAAQGGRSASTFGLRVLDRPGIQILLRIGVALVFFAHLTFYLVVLRPDLAQPALIGQDPSNYFAAGQRLNDGHPLYELSPGDRPVPLLPPPSADAPILSPPLLGVVWRPLVPLGDPAMAAWWLVGAVALVCTTLWMTLHASGRRLVLIYAISFFLAETVWSGNVNPFIVCLVIGVWAAWARGRSGLAGALAALAAGLKLAPAYLLWWFIVRKDWSGVRGFLAMGAVLATVSLLGAGFANHVAFLDVARETTTAGPTLLSIAGMLRYTGLPPEIASAGTFAWTFGAGVAVWLLRHRPRASFAAAVLMVLYSSPVILFGHLGLLLAVGAPFAAARELARLPRPAKGLADAPLTGAADSSPSTP